MSALLHTSSARGRAIVNRPGFVPGVCGALIIAQLFVLRLVANADLNSVTFAGRTLHWDCLFRQRFGVPCPTCGLTRSFLLTLHGQLNLALQLNPAGMLLVVGLFIFACALLCVTLCTQMRASDATAARLRQYLRFGATAYSGLFFVVLLTHWLSEIWPR